MYREAMAKQGERNDLDNNVIHVDTPQGNSRAYSIDRVKRECEPEMVAKVMSRKMGCRTNCQVVLGYNFLGSITRLSPGTSRPSVLAWRIRRRRIRFGTVLQYGNSHIGFCVFKEGRTFQRASEGTHKFIRFRRVNFD